MDQVLVYAAPSGGVQVVNAAPGFDLTKLAADMVPAGAASAIVDRSSLPTDPQSTWLFDASGKLTSSGPIPPSDAIVSAERDRRIQAGFRFQGVIYQTRPEDITNVLGATQLAFMAVVGGAKAGNYRWSSPNTDFVFIAQDNSNNKMDAQTVVAFGSAVAAFKGALTYAARAIKDAIAGGATIDYTADSSWGMALYGDPLPSNSTGSTGATGSTAATGATS